MIEKIVEKEGV